MPFLPAATAILVWLLGANSHAVSFLMFDAKTMGTSGAGSMTAHGNPQPHTNPSTWSPANARAELNIYLGARLTDRENFIDTLEALERKEQELKLEEQLQSVKRALRKGSVNSEQLRSLAATADIVRTEIETLPNKPLRIGSGGGVSLLATRDKWSLAAFVTRYNVLGSVVENDPNDLLTIERLSSATKGIADVLDNVDEVEDRIKEIDWPGVEDLLRQSWEANRLAPELKDYRNYPGVAELEQALEKLETNIEALDQHIALEDLIYTIIAANKNNLPATFELDGTNLRDYLRYPLPDDINTRVIYSGAEVTETGLNLSAPVERVPGLTLGVNIKRVNLSTIAFSQRVDEFDLGEYTSPGTRLDYGFWNIDVGIIHHFSNGVRLGLAVKGLRHKQLHTLHDNTINIEPLVRAGVSYKNRRFKLAMDADITENEPLGFDPDKKYLSFGGEWFFMHGQALRLGYRYNAVDHTGLPSVGLGLAGGALSADLAVSYDERSREAGIGLQFGLRL